MLAALFAAFQRVVSVPVHVTPLERGFDRHEHAASVGSPRRARASVLGSKCAGFVSEFFFASPMVEVRGRTHRLDRRQDVCDKTIEARQRRNLACASLRSGPVRLTLTALFVSEWVVGAARSKKLSVLRSHYQVTRALFRHRCRSDPPDDCDRNERDDDKTKSAEPRRRD
jgi:hypothetical protein